MAAIPVTLPTQEVREQMCLNGIWDLTPDGYAKTTIQVPSTWQAGEGGGGGGFGTVFWKIFSNFDTPENPYWQGGVYTRSFQVPSAMNGKLIKLHFNSVRFQCTVYVNSTQVGTNSDGFLPFEYDINNQLDGDEEIKVDLDAAITEPNGYRDGYGVSRGIWQDVWLRGYPWVYVTDSIFVKTSVRNNQISVDVPVKNASASSKTFYIRNFVVDASSNTVFYFDVSGWQTLAAGASATYSASCTWSNPICGTRMTRTCITSIP